MAEAASTRRVRAVMCVCVLAASLKLFAPQGFTYYPGNTEKELRKPLGFVDAKDILTVCDMGQLKKRDFCIEVITKERTWYLWAGTLEAVVMETRGRRL